MTDAVVTTPRRIAAGSIVIVAASDAGAAGTVTDASGNSYTVQSIGIPGGGTCCLAFSLTTVALNAGDGVTYSSGGERGASRSASASLMVATGVAGGGSLALAVTASGTSRQPLVAGAAAKGAIVVAAAATTANTINFAQDTDWSSPVIPIITPPILACASMLGRGRVSTYAPDFGVSVPWAAVLLVFSASPLMIPAPSVRGGINL